MAVPKKRKPPTARALANLRPTPSNLKRGGKKPTPLTYSQLEFCGMRARGLGRSQAAMELGVTWYTARNWETQNTLINATIEEYREQLKINAFEKMAEKIELRDEFLDSQTISRLQRAKKTDMAIAKLIHTGYQRTGAIKSASVSASANAGAAAGIIGGTVAEIYKSKWLRENEAQMAAKLEAEYANK